MISYSNLDLRGQTTYYTTIIPCNIACLQNKILRKWGGTTDNNAEKVLIQQKIAIRWLARPTLPKQLPRIIQTYSFLHFMSFTSYQWNSLTCSHRTTNKTSQTKMYLKLYLTISLPKPFWKGATVQRTPRGIFVWATNEEYTYFKSDLGPII